MKLLVTGAAGQLGSATVQELHAKGHEVIATDVKARRPLPVPLHEANLIDTAAVAALCEGVEAVVHLGNHTGVGRGKRVAAQTFNENVSMNMNVFQGALEAGAKRVVFASTVQVFASESEHTPFPEYANRVAYLPLDAESPENPGNAYSLSKSVGETILKQYLAPHGLTCISLRFPAMRLTAELDRFRNLDIARKHTPARITQGFSVLSTPDAVAAILAVLTADLSGYHAFFPAVSQFTGAMVPKAIEQLYPNVPLKRPIDQIDSLVDHSHLTRATGWRPRDIV